MLYNSLDPTSIAQHLAFYELYQPHPASFQAIEEAFRLLSGKNSTQSVFNTLPLSLSVIHSLIHLVNRSDTKEIEPLDEKSLQMIEKFSERLSHKKLKGHHSAEEQDVLKLLPEEVDLARGLFISQFGQDLKRIRTYEALIDLMALQILVRLPFQATPEQKIHKINELIFEEMGFRFPPHSLYAKDIDLYTFLPSVLDSHKGVCLGVSILYLCLAQRLDLRLEMITPPGHIYVRYRAGNKIINIETTARGIHIDCEEYLGINTHSLQQRTIKEVIGLAHFNQASVFWQNEHFEDAYNAYQEAKKYVVNDPLLNELLGYVCLLTNRKEEGEKLLYSIRGHVPDHAIVKNTVAEDYLRGNVDIEGIKVLFTHFDEDRLSILRKKEQLEAIVKKHPQFRAGVLYLALTWMELYRAGEALEALKNYHQLNKEDPESNYYLSALYSQRHNYQKAWEHLRKLESILVEKKHQPEALKDLRKSLSEVAPE